MLRSLATSSIALIVGASPVFADLTPTQVWESLNKYYTDSGYTVTVGEETETADGLELSDVVLTADVEAGEGASTNVKMVFPKVSFTEADNASVKSVVDGDITIESTSQSPEGKPIEFDAVITAPGNETISSGTPEDIRHEYNFPTTKMTLTTGEPAEGETQSEPNVTGVFSLNELTGFTTLKQGETWDVEQEVTAKAMEYDFTGVEAASQAEEAPSDAPTEAPAEAGEPTATESAPSKFTLKGAVDGFNMTATGKMPGGIPDATSKLDEVLAAGLDMDAKMAFGATTGEFNVDAPEDQGGAGSGKFTIDGVDLNFAMSKEGLTYEGSTKASQFEMAMAAAPFPISYGIESGSFALAFPVSQAEEAQPFTFKYDLAGLTFADGIWDMFDPQKQLPRDPASLAVDVEGTALVSQNLFDPALGQAAEGAEAGADAGATPTPTEPFMPQTVKINKVALDAVGVTADVTGDLTIPEGAQQPVGTLSGDFNGVNALIDKLVAIGLVPQEQVMGARMMMTMFAKPVDGDPDKLHSEIEFKENGSIFANGQQIK